MDIEVLTIRKEIVLSDGDMDVYTLSTQQKNAILCMMDECKEKDHLFDMRSVQIVKMYGNKWILEGRFVRADWLKHEIDKISGLSDMDVLFILVKMEKDCSLANIEARQLLIDAYAKEVLARMAG